jgi:RHS repeat-associated protein
MSKASTQRMVSKLGEMGSHLDMLNPRQMKRAGGSTILWDNKELKHKEQLIANFKELGLDGILFTAGKSGKTPYGRIKRYFREAGDLPGGGSDSLSTGKIERLLFFYHPDHLGSSSSITDASGEVYQHVQYFPFGETFVEERTGTRYTPYLYNGKELDEETGLYYYGARYYDPRMGMFYGVDVLAEKIPAWSPYSYTLNNPVRYIDPDGRLPIIPWMLKTTAGAAADMMAQASMDYLFNSNTTSWSQAFSNVNYYQVARSGAEGMIPWRTPGGRIGRAAGTALVDVLVNAANDPTGYTQEQAGMDFATGFIGDLAGGGFGELLAKYGAKNVANGLMNKLSMSYGDVMRMMGGGTKSINKSVNGVTSTRMMEGWAKGKVAVIGRDMDNRVIPFADGIGAEYWKGWNPNLSEAEN